MIIQNNVSLNDFTSLNLGGVCKEFFIVDREEQIPSVFEGVKSSSKRLLVLGGGSNLVINDQVFDGLVLKIEIQGIEVVDNQAGSVVLRVGAGVNWDDFVAYTVEHGIWGAENMSLIPGTVGAIPVQNVSAYGQEASKIIVSLTAYDRVDEKFKVLTNKYCQFSWRHSIFNTSHKERYIITSVDFKLTTLPSPNLKRLDLQKKVDDILVKENSVGDGADKVLQQAIIRKAVIALRTSGRNLPANKEDYNTGTFFRASLISKKLFYSIFFSVLLRIGLKTALKVLACRIKFGVGKDFKLPSNLLINACGCKSLNSKNFKLFDSNPAVLIHNGNGSAIELVEYIEMVRDCVYEKTGVLLPIEPEFVGIEKKV